MTVTPTATLHQMKGSLRRHAQTQTHTHTHTHTEATIKQLVYNIKNLYFNNFTVIT